MQIELATPPRIPPLKRVDRNQYDALFSAVVHADGEWVAVRLEDISGTTRGHKQTSVWGAAKQRDLSVQTTVQDGRMFVRLKKGAQ